MKRILLLTLAIILLMTIAITIGGCGIDGDPSHVVVDNAGAFPAGGGLSQEEVDDYVALLLNDADSVHTRITLTYDDADNAYDFVVDDMNDDQPDNDGEVPDAITVNAQAGSTWNLADTITALSVYTGGTSLEETTAANDSGAYIIGVFDEFDCTNATNVQDVLDDLDANLDDDDVTLADVQAASANDFHNIGGTDDDVPEAGDFGAATDLDANGELDDTSFIAILTAAGAITDENSGPAQTKVDGTNHDYYVLDFDEDTDEIAYWDFIMPPTYTGGNITPTVYWISTAVANDVVWSVQVLGREDSEAWDAALGAAQSQTTTTDGTAGDINTSTISAFSPSWSAGDLVIVKLFRDADNGSDTMAADARFLQLQLSWPTGWD